MLGTVDHQSELLDADQLCGLLIPEDSIHHKLAVLGNKLFTDPHFADLYDSARGRHSVPPSLLAKVMLLQSLEGTSDLDTVDRRNPRSVLRRLEEDENVRLTEETRPRSRQRNRSSDGLLDDLPKTKRSRQRYRNPSRRSDIEALDIAEGSEGIIAKIERTTETLSHEHELDEIYEQELEAGRFVIGVPVTDALDKSSAQGLLEKHGGRFINYYGSWAVEELKR
jgi:hypothetical protein